MASPLKKIKLTPKKSTLRATQESKVTSTPQCSVGSISGVSSPNVSNISSPKPISHRISDIFEEDEAVRNILRSPSIEHSTTTESDTSLFLDTLNIETGEGT